MIKPWASSSQIENLLDSWAKMIIIFCKQLKSGISTLSSIWGRKEVEERKSILLSQQLQTPWKINPKETETKKLDEEKKKK